MATMKDIIQSPLLLALVIGGLLYISAFSLVYLKKAYDHCLELGITRKELSNVIKSSLIFSVVPSLSIVVGLFVLIAVLGVYDSIPSLGEVFNVNTFSILLIYIPVGFSEALSYTPILGCSAYLAFITGNIMNLKLPVAANAMNLTKKQPNTPEGEAIASVAVAVSSLMTIAILTLAAVCASFISPVFELPAVKTASGYLLPALFGSMALGLFASSASGSKVVKGGIKGVLPVLIIMTALSLAARLAGYGAVLGSLVGIFIIVMLPIGILTSYVLWKKGKIQVVDKEQK